MKPTKDRTKLNAVWLPADVMRDKHHERECTYSRVIHYDDGSAEVDESCICDRLRLCKNRVLDAAREAVDVIRDAIYTHYRIECEPPGEVDWSQHRKCNLVDEIVAVIDGLRNNP